MSIKKKRRAINYTSRDFDSIKKDLIEYAKRYYPDTYKDFSEASFGSLMLDAIAYVGDIMSFYLDYQVNESFLQTSTEYDNLIKIGKQMGYKLESNSSSHGPVSFYINVPSNASGTEPDLNKVPTLKRGTRLVTTSGGSYMLNSDVNFRDPNNIVKVANVDISSGIPQSFSIKAIGEAVSGNLETETISVGDFKKFRKIKLETKDITEIISIIDDNGNEYYEVDNLSQDIIYKGTTNHNSDTDEPAQIMKPLHAAYRFITEREKDGVYLKFGSSSSLDIERDFIADPSSIVLDVNGKEYISDTSFDPFSLISSDKFGISPSNTTLTVVCRVNSGSNNDASTGEIRTITTASLKWLEPAKSTDLEKSQMTSSLMCRNEEPFQGFNTLPTKEELRERISMAYFSQNRAVTANDYSALVYNMPPKFGSVKRVRVERDDDSLKGNINLYVVSTRTGTFVKTNGTIKNNLKTWLSTNKMINDTIDILDAKVVNFGLHFTALSDLESDPDVVEREAESRLREYFSKKMNIGEHISLTDIYSELRLVNGLVDVKELKLTQKTSVDHSQTTFNFNKNLSSDGRYLRVPKNVVMEVKDLFSDINGVVE